jgi:hypothetical protein
MLLGNEAAFQPWSAVFSVDAERSGADAFHTLVRGVRSAVVFVSRLGA